MTIIVVQESNSVEVSQQADEALVVEQSEVVTVVEE